MKMYRYLFLIITIALTLFVATAVSAAPVIVSSPANVSVATGETATFFVTATGDELTYQWWRDGVLLTDGFGVDGSVTATLVLATSCSDDDSRFYCVVADATGSTTSATARLRVSHKFDQRTTAAPVSDEAPTCTEGVRYFYTCVCGAVGTKFFEGEPLGHTGGTATCSTLAVCTRCGGSYGTLIPHRYGGWVGDDAEHWRLCADCGSEIDRGAHTPGPPATETTAEICTHCGLTLTPPLGHSHDLIFVPRLEPGCTSAGHIAYYYCACGKFFDDAASEHEIAGGEALLLPPQGHAFLTYVANDDATCTADGTETAQCSRCTARDTRVAVGSAFGHQWGDFVDNDDATCTEDGTETASCLRCDVTLTRPRENTALGHRFGVYHDDDNATCTVDGTETAICDRCGTTDTRVAVGSALGHDYGPWQSDENGHWRLCNRCGESSLIEGHIPGPAPTETTPQRCTFCDHLLEPSLGHHHRPVFTAGTAPTCTEQGIFDHYRCDCGKRFWDIEAQRGATAADIVRPALGHDFDVPWTVDAESHFRRCSRCDSRGEEAAHSGGAATHFAAARCAVCDAPYGGVIPHDFSEREVADEYLCTAATCKEQATYYVSCACGAKGSETFPFGPFADHDFSAYGADATCHWRVCRLCGEEGGDKQNHQFVVDANRSDAETEVSVCLCGREKRETKTKTKPFPFTDVPEGSWYREDVAYVYERGLVNGITPTLFGPAKTTSRGMIVTILYRLDGSPTTAHHSYRDVKADAWYAAAVSWATGRKIVMGYGDGRFGPNDAITREQMATILYRYATVKGIAAGGASLSGFGDVNDVSAWARPAFAWAVSKNIINGVPVGKGFYLQPKGRATRAQTAAILHRFCLLTEYKASFW